MCGENSEATFFLEISDSKQIQTRVSIFPPLPGFEGRGPG